MAGLFKSQERAKQEAKGLEGLSIKKAHLLGNIGDPEEIEQSQQKTVEHREDAGSVSLAHLTVIFAQRHVAPPVEPIFYGPVVTHQLQKPLSRGVSRREAGDTIHHFRPRHTLFK